MLVVCIASEKRGGASDLDIGVPDKRLRGPIGN